jgi:drug/metabolite transporter (DMT)-like permease
VLIRQDPALVRNRMHRDRVGKSRGSASAVWGALAVVYVGWGSTYVAIRIMDRTIPPLIGAGTRYLLAGAAMYAFLWWRRGSAPRVPVRELGSVALVSVLLLTVGNGFVSVSEQHVPPGLAALVVASVPLWLLVIRVLTRDRPSRGTLAGLSVGFFGVALLVLKGRTHGVSLPDLLIVLGASMSWAVGSWASSRLPMPADAATGTALEMLIGGIVLAGLGPLLGESWPSGAGHASAGSLLAVVYLALIGSILAFTAYVWLLQNAPISKVSTYAYVNPLVAVLLGVVLLGERLTGITIAGGVIILLAVALVIRAEPRAIAPQPPDGAPESLAISTRSSSVTAGSGGSRGPGSPAPTWSR